MWVLPLLSVVLCLLILWSQEPVAHPLPLAHTGYWYQGFYDVDREWIGQPFRRSVHEATLHIPSYTTGRQQVVLSLQSGRALSQGKEAGGEASGDAEGEETGGLVEISLRTSSYTVAMPVFAHPRRYHLLVDSPSLCAEETTITLYAPLFRPFLNGLQAGIMAMGGSVTLLALPAGGSGWWLLTAGLVLLQVIIVQWFLRRSRRPLLRLLVASFWFPGQLPWLLLWGYERTAWEWAAGVAGFLAVLATTAQGSFLRSSLRSSLRAVLQHAHLSRLFGAILRWSAGSLRTVWQRLQREHNLLVLLLICYSAISFFLPFSEGVSPTNGDEPHYLLMAHSLAHDGDLHLLNNYQQQHYRHFSLSTLDTHLREYQGRIVPHHTWGLPILILPAYCIGGRVGVLLFLNILVALAMVALYRISRLFLPRSLAFGSILLLALTYPIITYSHQIYPETVAFAIVSFALLAIVTPPTRAGATTGHLSRTAAFRARALLVGLSLSLLPHLHYKMGVLSVVLSALFLWSYRTHLLLVLRWSLGPVVLMATLFFLMLHTIYGTISLDILRIHHGSFETPLWQVAAYGIPGLWFDQEYGLMFIAPIYLLSLPGLWFCWQNRIARPYVAPFVLLYAIYHAVNGIYWDWNAGLSPVPRYLIPVLPVLILSTTCAIAFCWRGRLWIPLLVAGSLQLWILNIVLQRRHFVYGFREGSNTILRALYRAHHLTDVLPSFYQERGIEDHIRLGFLLTGLVLFWVVAGWGSQLWFAAPPGGEGMATSACQRETGAQ